MKPRLIVEQKITAFANAYRIFKADDGGRKAELIAFAQQKRLAFKEQVTFYSDEAKTQAVFSFRAEKVMDVHGRYLVEDTEGKLIGSFKKEFGKSLLNSTWNIVDANDNPKTELHESNHTLAVMRRFGGFIPFVGGIVEIITALFKYHFEIIDLATNQIAGKYEKTSLFYDHYTLHLTDGAYAQNDWRVLASVAVALDALQSR